ncbi:hypothetical protein [Paenibacillus doosanensis]|uniref:hypothetical protein n=1 Tax=Paenibacillus doosanensis TaxID=1229154 RepID=UPI0035C834B5
MRKYRQLHLWIGLLTSVLILIEAVTGLLLSEPALMGQGQSSRTEMRVPAQNSGAAAASLPSGVSTDAAGAVQVQVQRYDVKSPNRSNWKFSWL